MKKSKKNIFATIAVLVVFLFLALIFIGNNNSDIIQNNLLFGSINIGGMSKTAASEKILENYNEIEKQGLKLQYGDKTINIPDRAAAFDADLSYQNFHYDRGQLEEFLLTYKRPNIIEIFWKKLFSRHFANINPQFKIEENRIKTAITEAFPESLNPAVNAAFIFTENGIIISPEKPGKIIDWDNLFTEISQRLNNFDQTVITIKTKTEYPTIYSNDLKGLEAEANSLSTNPLTLTFKDKKWVISREEIASWLSAEKDKQQLRLNFETEKIVLYLEKEIAEQINIAPQEQRFEIKDNKVSSWQLGKDGFELDNEASAAKIVEIYASTTEAKTIELIIKIIPPATAESFDIQEIIGTGHSNFAGSPKNRRHNIAVGAEALQGLIIKPGEEFSLVKALGDIDASAGYLPELVIKGDKTIPEYGGGLCQIGTTLFRSALSSGLPITARQNHSYRVAYYEPAGTDAAIYDPWPDVRFINDSAKSILIQTRIEKDDIYFDFWGTLDGRIASTSKPVVYNIVKPAETKIIPSDELKPGEKKCTERAHNGADAYFDYTVIYPEGATTTSEQTRRFKSHYVPWQEVCLVGKTATSTTATTTDSLTATTSTSTKTE
jgi:vancomycin resistance protein YoaR